MITIIPTTLEHAELLSQTLSKIDQQELMLCGYFDAQHAILLSINCSHMCYTAINGAGEVLAVAGVVDTNVLNQTGSIWMLHGEGFGNQEAIALARYSRRMLDLFLIDYDKLYNRVYIHNNKAIAWLKWLGFEFKICNKDFYYFSITKNKEV